MVVRIPLSKTGKHAGKYEAIVSDEDADLAELNWSLSGSDNKFYALYMRRTPEKRITFLLHRIIMERVLGHSLGDGLIIDHISGDTLDCRRDNLRLATYGQNNYNSKKRRNNKSGYKGVSYDKSRDKWFCQIRYNGKRVFIKRYDTPEEAYAAYCEKAKELHGDFARLD